MKRTLVLISALVLPFLLACGGGGGGGLFSPDSGVNPYGYTFTNLTTTNSTLGNGDVQALAQTANGLMYIGTGGGLYKSDLNGVIPAFAKVTDAGLLNPTVNALLKTANGDLWIGTDVGLYSLSAVTGSITTVLPTRNVRCLAEEASGTVWVGFRDLTASETVMRIDKNGQTLFGSAKSLTASEAVSIYAVPNLVMVCGRGDTGKGGLFKFVPANDLFVKNLELPLASGATFFWRNPSSTDQWYAGGPGGLFVSNNAGGGWNNTPLITDTPYGVSQMYGPAGLLGTWFATDKGMYLTYDFSKFQRYDSTSGLGASNCKSVVLPSQGQLIIGHPTTGGISRAGFSG